MACNDEWCKSPLDECGAVMNNAGCCSVPGHWTQLSACPSLISKHSWKKNNNIIITMKTPLSLCIITLLLFPSTHSLFLFPVIHFISSLCLCPRLIASSLLSACLPSLFPCESIRKLFTVIFLRLLLLPAPPLPGREWANARLIGCQPRRLPRRVFFPIKSHRHCCSVVLPSWPGESLTQQRRCNLKSALLWNMHFFLPLVISTLCLPYVLLLGVVTLRVLKVAFDSFKERCAFLAEPSSLRKTPGVVISVALASYYYWSQIGKFHSCSTQK